MRNISVNQRIFCLVICFAIILTGNVMAVGIASKDFVTVGSDEPKPTGMNSLSHCDDEEEVTYCSYCGSMRTKKCANSNVLWESGPHTYGANQRCTVDTVGSFYYYTCDMSYITGCLPYLAEEHICYMRHYSCGKGYEDFHYGLWE